MENASKALIIAGAILLAILIISLGIMIFNQASGVIDNNAMDEVSVSSFNKKFTQYEGKNVRGANVNALLETIIQNNLANTDDASKQVSVVLNTKAGTWTSRAPTNRFSGVFSATDIGKALQTISYTVTTQTDSKSGFVNTITIQSN